MSYKKTNWINDKTALNADNMNNIENGIDSVSNKINNIIDDYGNVVVNTISTEEINELFKTTEGE